MYDLIVVGAGPAGVMAAIQASQRNKKVLLLEQNNSLLMKLKISGNSRCNITNNKSLKDFMLGVDNSKYFYNIISKFPPLKIIDYLNDLGVELKEEDHNRMFPVSDDATSISEALISQLKDVVVKTNTKVSSIAKVDDLFNVTTKNGIFQASNLLLATGGISYAELGCSIDNFNFAKKFNHTITKLVAQECPIETHDPLQSLMGLSLKNINIIIKDQDKPIEKITGDLLFTHFGLSGPIILNSSFGLNKAKSEDVYLSIQLINQDYETARKTILEMINNEPRRLIKNSLLNMLPLALVDHIITKLDIKEVKNAELNKKKISELAHQLSDFSFKFKTFYQPQYAFLTGGGINTKELKPKTLESKLIDNLYFAGETLDVCGKLGGYNISIALACGYVVGNNI